MIPSHVPQNLVMDIDHFDLPGHREDPFLAWKTVQSKSNELAYSPRHGGFWIAMRGKALSDLYRDNINLSNKYITIPALESHLHIIPGESDAPLHPSYRAVLQPSFLPKSVDAMEKRVRQVATEQIEHLKSRGGCEFIGEFGHVMPIVVFLGLVDLPLDDKPRMMEWAEAATREGDIKQRMKAFQETLDYLDHWIKLRKEQPGKDLISVIANSRIGERQISDDEALGMSANVLLGGLDTIASTMGFIARFLADNPKHRKLLIARPELIPAAVDEFLRRFSIANLSRVVARDFVYNGVTMKTGDRLLLPTCLHGMDERVFKDPLSVNFERGTEANILAFGNGPHRCLGMYLARFELRIFLQEWLARIPHFEVTPGQQPVASGGTVLAMTSLPLSWTTH